MRKITAFFLLFLLVGSSFIMFLPPISGQETVSTEQGFEMVDDFIAGVSDTDWQKDTRFTANSEISVNGGDMVLDFNHESWQWNTITWANSTWVIHETRNVWGFGYIQYACNNNLEGVIKCWLRGDVSIPTDYRIGVSRGTWNPQENTYKSFNGKYQLNLTDIADYGFPITYDEDTSQIVIGVSGIFDIDPTITELGSDVNKQNNDLTVTVGHWDYVFYKSLDNWVQYQYRNSTDETSRWHNGSKIWAVNRTEYSERPNGFAYVGTPDNPANYPHVWKTNGTHIYGAVATMGDPDKIAARFYLFNTTKLNDASNSTGYDVGSLVLHTNATIPCLGVAMVNASCGGFAPDGSLDIPKWKQEVDASEGGPHGGGCGLSCFMDVEMNSTGFPMVIYGTMQQLSGLSGGCTTAGYAPCTAPAIVVAIAENPVGAMCRERLVHTERACDANDARNGANGTWTQPYQVDTYAERLAGGSGYRYLWYTEGQTQELYEGSVCSMGNGNMLMIWHNRTAASSNQGSVWGRFWYQSNATWGSEYMIYQEGWGSSGSGQYWLAAHDSIDLTCTPDASGTMTAHVAWSVYYAVCWASCTSHSGAVLYRNFTDARGAANNPFNSEDLTGTCNVSADMPSCTQKIQVWEQFVETYANGVQVAADNSTGTIGVFYFTNRGDSFYNFTGYSGTQGFGRTSAVQTEGICGLTGSDYDSGPPSAYSFSAAPFMNGTSTDSSLGSFWIFGCYDPGGTIEYTHWLNSSITSTLTFYHPDGTAVQVQNMTFTSRVNGTQLGVFDCSVCTAGLTAGTYQVDGIFLNGIDMEYNGTTTSPTFYIDLANTTASFIVGNMTVTYVFKDEVTLADWDVSAKPLKIDMWTVSNTKENQTTIDESGDLTQFVSFTPARIKVSFGDSYQYYRWDADPKGCLTSGCDTTVTFYLPDYDKYTVTEYTWNFVDQPQEYGNGTVLFRKYTSVGLIQVGHPALSVPDNQVQFFGILNHEYSITVFSIIIGSGEPIDRSDIGIWTAEATPTTINANIVASPLFEDIALAGKYIIFQAQRTICTAEDIANNQNQCYGEAFGGAAHSNVTIYFKDIKGETTEVTFEIFNRTGLQYTTTLTGSPSNATILWQGADTNISHTYWIKMTATSSRFGSVSETRPVVQASGQFGPMIPIGRCTVVCDGSLLDNFSPYYVYISMIILIFTVGIFSQATAAICAIITALVANMLYFFGWLPGLSPLILGVITLLSFIYMFAVAKGR